jgi:uncharacterized protein
MPIQVSYPGVYLEEIPGGQPVVAGVSTASTAFVDFFSRGPMNTAVRVASMQDVERIFGGLHRRSEASYGLRQYFLNGGQEAWLIRAGDGLARPGELRVPIRTPGLPARVKASFEDFQAARTAADEAKNAATAAGEALQKLQSSGITDEEREQGVDSLRSNSRQAAELTKAAAAATRKAAVQARAASDELAIAIAKVKAASGPVADRTAMAAEKSAEAADASAKAAKAASDVTAVAQRADPVAEAALRASAGARTAQQAASQIKAVLDAAAVSKTAAGSAAKEVTDFGENDNQGLVQQAAVRAATAAQSAADEAVKAAAAARTAAQTVLDQVKAQGEDTKAAKAAVDDADTVYKAARESATKASKADWDAQTAGSLEGAQDALKNASDVAAEASGIAGGADKAAAKNAQGVATSLLGAVLEMAAAAATAAGTLASKAEGEPEAGEPEAADTVVGDGIGAIDGAIQAAKDAAVAASGAADDAKVAADSVTSGGPALAARTAGGSVTKAGDATRTAIESAKATKLQINQANAKALAAGPPATAAATAAGKKQEDPRAGVDLALDTAQKALNAADSSLESMQAIQKASTTTSQVSVAASISADGAAEAAQAAVLANQEAVQDPTLIIQAQNPGVWGNNLLVSVTVDGTLFSLTVSELVSDRGVTRQLSSETYNQLTLDDGNPKGKPAAAVVNHGSHLLNLSQFGPRIEGAYPQEVGGTYLSGGDDGGLPNADQLTTAMLELDKIEPAIFNILCLPVLSTYDDAEASVAISQAQAYCAKKRAFFIADIPQRVDSVDKMLGWVDMYGNAAAYHMGVYFPRLVLPDPLDDYRPRNVPSSGTLAGIYARTDTTRGVWKAPAGVEAVIQGAEVAVKLTDDQNGLLNPRGVNALRTFPVYGNIAWGARTLAGADALSSEYKYINVRRLMSYVEESIFRSIKWAVFEPNNETLWAKIRLQVNGFLGGLFADGAFQGAAPAQAYFVRCDGTTTTPLDIDLGVVNVVVGVAPVKPAEFVVLQFQQIAGQSA